MIRTWKKVFESDYQNIVLEIKDLVLAPAVIYFEGNLGAGKTTFCKEFIAHFESHQSVSSPTYSLIHEYEKILHADLYRLENKDELIPLEIPVYLEEKDYFIIEWGERFHFSIEKYTPEEFKFFTLKLEINPETQTGVASRNLILSKKD